MAAVSWREVLRFGNRKIDQSKVGRAYARYRAELGIRVRCDNVHCHFHTAPLQWNGESLRLILDHKNGNSFDNSPDNLQYVCPNCNSQLGTYGGRNRGRVRDRTDKGVTVVEYDQARKVKATAVYATAETTAPSSASGVSAPTGSSPDDRHCPGRPR